MFCPFRLFRSDRSHEPVRLVFARLCACLGHFMTGFGFFASVCAIRYLLAALSFETEKI
jgi:hypothetical protein